MTRSTRAATATPLRLALVHPFSWPTVRRGGERYLDDLRSYLVSAGHRVDVITGSDEASDIEWVEGARIIRRRYRLTRSLGRTGLSKSDLFGLAAVPPLLRTRYDVVHTLVPTTALASRLGRQPTLYTVLGHPTADQYGVRPLDLSLFRAAARAAQQVTALSAASANATRQLTGRGARVLPPGVRTERFPAELRPRDGALRVLFSADANDGRKGADLLVAAFERVLRSRPDARLQHSGQGSMDRVFCRLGATGETVRGATDDLGVGQLTEVADRYRRATVTVLPARHEAFGLSIVESLAAGTPVVCCDDGGPPEILDDPAVGRVVPLGDSEGLADAILAVAKLAAEPVTPARCVRHARRWDWQKAIGPAHEAVYREMLRRRA